MLPVYEAAVQYLRPAKYDDLLEIHLVVTHTRVKIRFEYKVHRSASDEVVALGHTVHVCVGRDGKPTRAPEWLLKALDGRRHG
jgi:acyl-CoA thioester hydrolase